MENNILKLHYPVVQPRLPTPSSPLLTRPPGVGSAKERAMAESVKKLAQSESFQGLQEKVTYWVNDYKVSQGLGILWFTLLSFSAQS